MSDSKRGRKPIPADQRKVKLTLTVRPDIREALDRIVAADGLASISELLERYTEARLEADRIAREEREKALAKEARRLAREAKKAGLSVSGEQCEGQTRIEDFVN